MITLKHQKEWHSSLISEDLINSNLVSLDDIQAFKRVLYSPNLKGINAGVPSSIARKYNHLYHGGWYCKSYDPLTHEQMDWIQFKPDCPRNQWKRKDNQWVENGIVKYETPPKEPTRVIFPYIPRQRWEQIAKKYDISITKHDNNFWSWVIKHPELPITITEGAKKCLSLLSQNIIAFGLPGIWNTTDKQEIDEKTIVKILKRDIEIFLKGERIVNICFDQDPKLSTRKKVNKAIFALSDQIKKHSCKPFILSWKPSQGKGIDDLLFASTTPEQDLQEIYQNRKSFELWTIDYLFRLSRNDLEVNSRFLSQSVSKLPNHKLIGLKSPQNTGKTEVIANHVQEILNQGYPCFILVHLESLAKSLSKRFNVPYRTENNKDKNWKGFSLCIDSLMPKKNNGVTTYYWDEPVIVIDEVEQVLDHLVNGTTEIKKYRPTILNTLIELCNNCHQVIIADADLSDISVDLFEKLLHEKAYIIENKYKFDGMNFYKYEKANYWLGNLLDCLEKKEKIFITTSSQSAKSKFGTIALEQYIVDKFESFNKGKQEKYTLKILRIDSETLNDPEHEAYKCLTRINEIITQYDVILASPSICTGVSIDVYGYFDKVFGYSGGNVTPHTFLQMMWRLRDLKADRHYFSRAVGDGNQYVGNSSCSPKSLLKSTKQLAKFTIAQLNMVDSGYSLDDFDSTFLQVWAKIGARKNASNRCYKAILEDIILAQGHNMKIARLEKYVDNELIKSNRNKCVSHEHKNILEANKIDDLQADLIEKKSQEKGICETEKYQLKKHKITKKYGDITEDLLYFDDDGNYSKLQLVYYLTIGNIFLNINHQKKVKKQAEDNSYRLSSEDNSYSLFSPDINKSSKVSPQVKLLEYLNIFKLIEYINEKKIINNHDEKIIDFYEKMLKIKNNLKDIGINAGKYPIASINSVLKKIGMKLKSEGVERDGDGIVRYYSLEKLPEFCGDILYYWFLNHTAQNADEMDSVAVTNFLFNNRESFTAFLEVGEETVNV